MPPTLIRPNNSKASLLFLEPASTRSYLGTFALSVSSAWNFFLPDTHIIHSCHVFTHILTSQGGTLSNPYPPSSFCSWHSHHLTSYIIHEFCLHLSPHSLVSSLDCKFSDGRNLYMFCLLLYPQHLGQCQEHSISRAAQKIFVQWMNEWIKLSYYSRPCQCSMHTSQTFQVSSSRLPTSRTSISEPEGQFSWTSTVEGHSDHTRGGLEMLGNSNP